MVNLPQFPSNRIVTQPNGLMTTDWQYYVRALETAVKNPTAGGVGYYDGLNIVLKCDANTETDNINGDVLITAGENRNPSYWGGQIVLKGGDSVDSNGNVLDTTGGSINIESGSGLYPGAIDINVGYSPSNGGNINIFNTSYGTLTIGGGFNPVDVIVNGPISFYNATTDYISFNTAPSTSSTAIGTLSWNATDETLDLIVKNGTTLQIGQESYIKVLNKSGTNFLNGQVVYISGAQGQRLTAELAQANSEVTSRATIGILTENINNNHQGFATTSGLVRDIDTSAWTEGDPLYLSASTAGGITNVKPTAPNHTVILGWVVRSHAVNGSIYVKVDNGLELDELHDVKITTPVTGDVLTYDSSTSLWKNATQVAITQGTFTPTFISTGSTFSYAVQQGTWTKIGNMVTVSVVIQLNTTGNTLAASTLSVGGCPFTPAYNNAALCIWKNCASSQYNMAAYAIAGNPNIPLGYLAALSTSFTASYIANRMSPTLGSEICFTLTFRV